MTDPVTPEEARELASGILEANCPLVRPVLSLAAQLEAADKSLVRERLRYHEQKQRAEAAQKVIEAARELDWDSYAEEQGKPEVDLSGLWDSLAAYDEQVKP